jgi:hypothetical protein
MGVNPWKETYLAVALDIVSGRREVLTLNIQNDRSDLELYRGVKKRG